MLIECESYWMYEKKKRKKTLELDPNQVMELNKIMLKWLAFYLASRYFWYTLSF